MAARQLMCRLLRAPYHTDHTSTQNQPKSQKTSSRERAKTNSKRARQFETNFLCVLRRAVYLSLNFVSLVLCVLLVRLVCINISLALIR